MLLAGIVGNNAPFSYNRLLLQFMKTAFAAKADIQVNEIKQIPLFNEANLNYPPESVSILCHRIQAADGVIIATPEYNHAVTASLKSTLEWLSCVQRPLSTKPVMIVGASTGVLGTARAQDVLRQILNSPGLNAFVMPGHEFLLNNAEDKFTKNGRLIDPETVRFLAECFTHFLRFVQALAHR